MSKLHDLCDEDRHAQNIFYYLLYRGPEGFSDASNDLMCINANGACSGLITQLENLCLLIDSLVVTLALTKRRTNATTYHSVGTSFSKSGRNQIFLFLALVSPVNSLVSIKYRQHATQIVFCLLRSRCMSIVLFDHS
jgi:hypothetical protein